MKVNKNGCNIDSLFHAKTIPAEEVYLMHVVTLKKIQIHYEVFAVYACLASSFAPFFNSLFDMVPFVFRKDLNLKYV